MASRTAPSLQDAAVAFGAACSAACIRAAAWATYAVATAAQCLLDACSPLRGAASPQAARRKAIGRRVLCCTLLAVAMLVVLVVAMILLAYSVVLMRVSPLTVQYRHVGSGTALLNNGGREAFSLHYVWSNGTHTALCHPEDIETAAKRYEFSAAEYAAKYSLPYSVFGVHPAGDQPVDNPLPTFQAFLEVEPWQTYVGAGAFPMTAAEVRCTTFLHQRAVEGLGGPPETSSLAPVAGAGDAAAAAAAGAGGSGSTAGRKKKRGTATGGAEGARHQQQQHSSGAGGGRMPPMPVALPHGRRMGEAPPPADSGNFATATGGAPGSSVASASARGGLLHRVWAGLDLLTGHARSMLATATAPSVDVEPSPAGSDVNGVHHDGADHNDEEEGEDEEDLDASPASGRFLKESVFRLTDAEKRRRRREKEQAYATGGLRGDPALEQYKLFISSRNGAGDGSGGAGEGTVYWNALAGRTEGASWYELLWSNPRLLAAAASGTFTTHLPPCRVIPGRTMVMPYKYSPELMRAHVRAMQVDEKTKAVDEVRLAKAETDDEAPELETVQPDRGLFDVLFRLLYWLHVYDLPDPKHVHKHKVANEEVRSIDRLYLSLQQEDAPFDPFATYPKDGSQPPSHLAEAFPPGMLPVVQPGDGAHLALEATLLPPLFRPPQQGLERLQHEVLAAPPILRNGAPDFNHPDAGLLGVLPLMTKTKHVLTDYDVSDASPLCFVELVPAAVQDVAGVSVTERLSESDCGSYEEAPPSGDGNAPASAPSIALYAQSLVARIRDILGVKKPTESTAKSCCSRGADTDFDSAMDDDLSGSRSRPGAGGGVSGIGGRRPDGQAEEEVLDIGAGAGGQGGQETDDDLYAALHGDKESQRERAEAEAERRRKEASNPKKSAQEEEEELEAIEGLEQKRTPASRPAGPLVKPVSKDRETTDVDTDDDLGVPDAAAAGGGAAPAAGGKAAGGGGAGGSAPSAKDARDGQFDPDGPEVKGVQTFNDPPPAAAADAPAAGAAAAPASNAGGQAAGAGAAAAPASNAVSASKGGAAAMKEELASDDDGEAAGAPAAAPAAKEAPAAGGQNGGGAAAPPPPAAPAPAVEHVGGTEFLSDDEGIAGAVTIDGARRLADAGADAAEVSRRSGRQLARGVRHFAPPAAALSQTPPKSPAIDERITLADLLASAHDEPAVADESDSDDDNGQVPAGSARLLQSRPGNGFADVSELMTTDDWNAAQQPNPPAANQPASGGQSVVPPKRNNRTPRARVIYKPYVCVPLSQVCTPLHPVVIVTASNLPKTHAERREGIFDHATGLPYGHNMAGLQQGDVMLANRLAAAISHAAHIPVTVVDVSQAPLRDQIKSISSACAVIATSRAAGLDLYPSWQEALVVEAEELKKERKRRRSDKRRDVTQARSGAGGGAAGDAAAATDDDEDDDDLRAAVGAAPRTLMEEQQQQQADAGAAAGGRSLQANVVPYSPANDLGGLRPVPVRARSSLQDPHYSSPGGAMAISAFLPRALDRIMIIDAEQATGLAWGARATVPGQPPPYEPMHCRNVPFNAEVMTGRSYNIDPVMLHNAHIALQQQVANGGDVSHTIIPDTRRDAAGNRCLQLPDLVSILLERGKKVARAMEEAQDLMQEAKGPIAGASVLLYPRVPTAVRLRYSPAIFVITDPAPKGLPRKWHYYATSGRTSLAQSATGASPASAAAVGTGNADSSGGATPAHAHRLDMTAAMYNMACALGLPYYEVELELHHTHYNTPDITEAVVEAGLAEEDAAGQAADGAAGGRRLRASDTNSMRVEADGGAAPARAPGRIVRSVVPPTPALDGDVASDLDGVCSTVEDDKRDVDDALKALDDALHVRAPLRDGSFSQAVRARRLRDGKEHGTTTFMTETDTANGEPAELAAAEDRGAGPDERAREEKRAKDEEAELAQLLNEENAEAGAAGGSPPAPQQQQSPPAPPAQQQQPARQPDVTEYQDVRPPSTPVIIAPGALAAMGGGQAGMQTPPLAGGAGGAGGAPPTGPDAQTVEVYRAQMAELQKQQELLAAQALALELQKEQQKQQNPRPGQIPVRPVTPQQKDPAPAAYAPTPYTPAWQNEVHADSLAPGLLSDFSAEAMEWLLETLEHVVASNINVSRVKSCRNK